MPSKKRSRWIIAAVLALAVTALAAYAVGNAHLIPANMASGEWADAMIVEGYQINECAECHAVDDFHTCETCHGDHGEVELTDVPFSSVIALMGDVPTAGYIPIQQIMPVADGRQTHYTVQGLLAEYGVESFSTLTFASNDGGFITLLASELTDRAYLLPYVDGLRFICEDLHASTWLKGITRIIVVQDETPLSINGEETSIGRILLGQTTAITVEETSVMLRSEEDGQVRSAFTAARVEGALLHTFFDGDLPETIQVQNADGEVAELNRTDLNDALLAQFHGETTLILPARGRQQWIMGVTIITGVQ